MRETLRRDDVVFMYPAKDKQRYIDYGATFLAWGGAHNRKRVRELLDIGVHPTATMWCLTAGSYRLNENADLRAATCIDIAGEPIRVPWLCDHVTDGTPTWFGCTNNPTFRAHVRRTVADAMAGAAHGLHVDDHLGTSNTAANFGGCFCDSCMDRFRRFLQEADDAELRDAAGVTDFDGFDYRDLVRRHARSRKEYLEVQQRVPLHQTFVDWQLRRAAENTCQLGALAEQIVEHPITLSANACLPHLIHTVVIPHLTHVVGEVEHYAGEGTAKLLNAVHAYRMAEALGRPLAATGAGWDWAWVAERDVRQLVRVWIALGYACGQRLMAPQRQWCFTEQKGTHYYEAPAGAFEPLFQFVRSRGELLRDYETVGPLKAPADVPASFETKHKREALRAALDRGDPRPLSAGEKVWVFPRRRPDGAAVVHLVNLDYDADTDTSRPHRQLKVELPRDLLDDRFEAARLYSYDGEPEDVTASGDEATLSFTIPELRMWTIAALR